MLTGPAIPFSPCITGFSQLNRLPSRILFRKICNKRLKREPVVGIILPSAALFSKNLGQRLPRFLFVSFFRDKTTTRNILTASSILFCFSYRYLLFSQDVKKPRQSQNEKNLLLAFIILFLLISFFRTSIRIRYIVPVLPALIILSTTGLHQLVGLLKTDLSPFLRRFGAVSLSAAMMLLFGMNAAIPR